jgi:hypothetical protein
MNKTREETEKTPGRSHGGRLPFTAPFSALAPEQGPKRSWARRGAAAARLAAPVAAALFLFVFVYGVAFPSDALAWEDCPKGLVNDPYPGRCGRYVDTNGDQICDLSQPKPASTTTTTLAPVVTSTGEPPTGDCPLGPCAGCGACFGFGVSAFSDEPTVVSGTTSGAISGAVDGDVTDLSVQVTSQNGSNVSFLTHYLVSPIALGFFVVYGSSFLLYKTKRMRVTTHRKVWNMLLLGTFLVTGIFGVILAIQLDYPLPFEIPIDLLFWHVEAGIAMTLISLFHLGWHFNYYRNLLRRTRRRVREAQEAERMVARPDRRLVTEARAQEGPHRQWKNNFAAEGVDPRA